MERRRIYVIEIEIKQITANHGEVTARSSPRCL